MALAACIDFQLPGCDFLEPLAFVNRYGELAGVTAGCDDSQQQQQPQQQRGVVATNLLAMRRMYALLVLPSCTVEPYASVARLLDETAHRAGVSDTRRPSHPCPVALNPYDATPRWLTLSLRVLVSQLLLLTTIPETPAIPKHELWVLDHLVAFPLTPAPPVFRLPFEVSDLNHIVGHFYQPRLRSQWQHGAVVMRPRPDLTQAESDWFYARLSAFAFYAYCTVLPPHAVWAALRLFFDRVETIVAQDRGIEVEAFKMRSVNPVLFETWSRWNEQMSMYAHWFVALYQVMERCPTASLAPVKALVGGVVAETLQEPFRELRSFMRDARNYWPAMYSCQAEFSALVPHLVPVQRVSRHEATALLQARLCRRDMLAFMNPSMPDEDPNCGTACFRLPDMLPSHMRATLEHLGFEAEDIAGVVMAPYFNGGGDNHTYDLFVRMHARHECAWQVASICDLPGAARPLFQRLGCAPRECLHERPSVLRTIQRAVLRLINSDGSLRHPVLLDSDVASELAFVRDACGASEQPSAALVFFCEAGLQSTRVRRDSVRLQTPIGATDSDMQRSVKQWSRALAAAAQATSVQELCGAMTRDRFRDIVRATAPLLDTVPHLRAFVMFACANPLLFNAAEDDTASNPLAMCVEIQQSAPPLCRRRRWQQLPTKPAPAFRLAESALGAVLMMPPEAAAARLSTVVCVVETLHALRDGVYAMADPLRDDDAELQCVAWYQTDDDMRLLREREAHARASGLRLRAAPVVTQSLALYPDQCGLVCASMRNCANGDDLVSELLLGPDAKCNWQPTRSEPEFFRIAQPPSSVAATAAVRPVVFTASATAADARSKAHFGESLPSLRHNFPENMRSARGTVRMTAEEVTLANQEQSIGQPTRTPARPPPPPAPAPVPVQQTTATATATTRQGKRSRSTATAAAQAPVQFNGAGKVIHAAAAATTTTVAKPKAGTTAPRRLKEMPWTASMIDFMEMDKS